MHNLNIKYENAVCSFINKDYERAMVLCSEIIEEEPSSYKTHFLLGKIFIELKDFKTAQNFLKLSISTNENFFYSYDLLASIYDKGERYNLALNILEKAISKFYDISLYTKEVSFTCLNMATIQNKLGNYDLAIFYVKKALNKTPSLVEAYVQLADAYTHKIDLVNARKYTKLYLEKYPEDVEMGFSYSYLLILNEEYAQGFKYYEYRLKRDINDTSHSVLPYTRYKKGDSLIGKKLCIYKEQGFGDNIQFSRYLNDFEKELNITFLLDPPQLKLFQYNFKNMKFVTAIRGDEYFDYQIPLLSIPYMFDKSFVNSMRYLEVSKDDIKSFSKKYIDNKMINIGIVWSSTSGNQDPNRLFSLKIFEKLFNMKGVQFYSLQKENTQELINYQEIKDLGSSFVDFYETSVAICSLDLVVSIDTSVAHLTGALGQKGYILDSAKKVDFRWGTKSGDSKWYDSLEIIKYDNKIDAVNTLHEKLKKEFKL